MTAITFLVALACLGHEDYDARASASKTLATLIRRDPASFGPPIAHLASTSPSCEVRSRAGRLCPAFNAWLADTYQPPCGRYPCADWGLCRAGLLNEWRYWFEQTPHGGPTECSPHWTRYRAASELYVRDMIRCGRWDWARADAAVKAGWLSEMEFFMANQPALVATVEPWSRR